MINTNPVLIPAICPQCGAQIEVNQNLEEGMCNYCGTKIIIKDVIQRIKIVGNPTVENYLKLAEREYDDNNYAEALEKYEKVLEIDPDNWKAVFRRGVCITRTTNLASFRMSDIVKSTKNAIKIIDSTDMQKSEKINIIVNMAFDIIITSFDLYKFAYNHYTDYWELEDSAPELWKRLAEVLAANEYAVSLLEKIEDKTIKCKSGENINDLLSAGYVSILNCCINICKVRKYKDLNSYTSSWIKDEYRANYVAIYDKYHTKLLEIEPNYKIEDIQRTGDEGGCYIATCVYGSYNCPQVWTLRRYRDYYLAPKLSGRLFIYIYYAISPTIVRLFGNSNWFKKLWKNRLDKMILKLQKEGYNNTPYKDIDWM